MSKKKEEEGVFAEMWYQDIEAKNHKEDEKQRIAKERNMEVSLVLKKQMQVLEQQKQEEKRIRLENAKLLVSLMFCFIHMLFLERNNFVISSEYLN